MQIRNLLSVLIVLTLGAVCVAGSAAPADRRATDGIVYAGPKTWLPGWDGQLGYGTYYRITNAFENRSIVSWARVAYILETGSWTCSFTSYSTLTGCADSDTRRRKAYCKNNRRRLLHGPMPRPFLSSLAALAAAVAAIPLASASAPTRALPAFTRARTPSDRIPAAVARRAATRLRLPASRLVAKRGGNRLFVAPSADGQLVCLVSSSADGEVGTGCSPPAMFTERVGFAVLIRDSGPGTPPTSVLAAANARVRGLVLAFDSSSRRVTPNADGGLDYTPAAREGRLLSISSVDASGKRIGILRVPRG